MTNLKYIMINLINIEINLTAGKSQPDDQFKIYTARTVTFITTNKQNV